MRDYSENSHCTDFPANISSLICEREKRRSYKIFGIPSMRGDRKAFSVCGEYVGALYIIYEQKILPMRFVQLKRKMEIPRVDIDGILTCTRIFSRLFEMRLNVNVDRERLEFWYG